MARRAAIRAHVRSGECINRFSTGTECEVGERLRATRMKCRLKWRPEFLRSFIARRSVYNVNEFAVNRFNSLLTKQMNERRTRTLRVPSGGLVRMAADGGREKRGEPTVRLPRRRYAN